MALVFHASESAAAKKKTKKPAPKTPVVAPAGAAALSEPPPADQLPARLQWAGTEAEGLRAIVARSPRDEAARVLLAALAVVVTSDLERALSSGDTVTAAALGQLVETKLSDTRWRLGSIARQGAGGGYFALGVMALHGLVGPQDRDIGCALFASAWDKGFLDAAFRLSECTAAKDPAGAASLLRSAADAGHAMAAEQVGRRCLEDQPRDTQCAFERVAAAAASRASARSLLGWMYVQGTGVTADPHRGRALYEEAARAGDLSAKNNLGELHETGRGVAVDAAKAAEYYRQAADAGFAPAQFNLGRLYAGGTGVPRDADKARTWLRSALAAGLQPAQKILDWLDAQPAAGR